MFTPKFVAWGLEHAPTTGTPHIQYCVAFGNRQVAQTTLKKWPGLKRAAIYSMDFSKEANLRYVSKEAGENTFVWGEAPKGRGGGRSKAMDEALADIKGGASIADVANKNGEAIVKFHKGLTIYRSLITPQRDRTEPPIVIWVSGGTGTGKTSWAFELGVKYTGSEDEVYITSDPKLHWWEGYDTHPFVVVDDFRPTGIQFSWLLRITDRYPVNVEFKGGSVKFKPRVIVFTGPECLHDTFATRAEHRPEDIRQLERRINGREFRLPEDALQLEEILSATTKGCLPVIQGSVPISKAVTPWTCAAKHARIISNGSGSSSGEDGSEEKEDDTAGESSILESQSQ